MFPRGIPSAALPAQSQVPSGLCSSRASRILGSLSLASSGHLTPHGQPGGGTRPPGSAPLHRLPARRPPPSRRSSAPRPAASCFVPHTMPPAPARFPPRCARNCASGTSGVTVTSEARAATSGRYRRQALSSPIPPPSSHRSTKPNPCHAVSSAPRNSTPSSTPPSHPVPKASATVRAIFELLYSSGLRSGELCKLTLYDLDRSKRLVTITQGKGRKDRLVPVGHIALEWLTRHLTESRPTLVAQAKPGPAATLLFLTKHGLPFTPAKLLHLVRSYAATHHLPASTTTHSLRHACATGMLRGGASIRHVQEMLGHSSIKTTQIYTHIVKDDLKAIHAKTAPSERRALTEAPAFEFTNWRPRKQKKPRATRKKGKPRKNPPKKKPPESSSP